MKLAVAKAIAAFGVKEELAANIDETRERCCCFDESHAV